MFSPATYVGFFFYIAYFLFKHNFCDDFFHEILNFFFKNAPFREKSIYRKNPTYVSCCCSVESNRLWFFVPRQKLRELGFRPWTLSKNRHRRRNAAQPPFCHERSWKKYFLYFITRIINPSLQNFDWYLYCAKKNSRNMPIFSCSTVV